MLGLLARAHKLRDLLHREGRLREDITFDPQSGISREDQHEIMKEIETVAMGNHMAVSPEAFEVHAVKRGVLFPVLAGIITLIVACSALAFLYFLFQAKETGISTQQAVGITAEGQLIAAMKKEADEKLAAKSQEINQIQGRLAEIDKQRQDLQNSMDQKVSEREKALRDAMAKELEDERLKLRNQGLSEETINQRLQTLETQKNAQFTQQLDTFKKQAEDERLKSEENLRTLESQYNASLAAANAEKQQAQVESQKREAELKSQLEQQAKALESAKTKAEQDLQAITAQREKEDLATNQLIGLYEVAKADIARQDYAKALVSLKAVGDFVTRTDVSVLPGMAERRDFDLFVVDSLTTLVQTERNQAQIDTAAFMAAAKQISTIKGLVTDAEALLAAGKTADAERAYSQAIQVLPDIQKSFIYLSKRQGDVDAARQAKVRAAIGLAEDAFAAGRQAEAMSAYREALSYLPETSDRLDKAMDNIQSVGFAQGTARARQEQSKAAAPLLARAEATSPAMSAQDALAMYVEILTAYPLSTQAAQAVQGIDAQVQRLLVSSSKTQATAQGALADQIASLQKDLAARQAEIAQLQKDSTARQAENAQLQKDLTARTAENAQFQKDINARQAETAQTQMDLAARQADLSRIKGDIAALIGRSGDVEKMETGALLDALKEKYASLEQGTTGSQQSQKELAESLKKTQEEKTKLLEQIDSLKVELAKAQTASESPKLGQADIQLLAKLQERISGLDSSYKGYTSIEDPIIASRGSKGLVDTKAYLDSFLASKPMEETFPGLLARIKRYDQGFQSAGRADALRDVLEIVIDLSGPSSAEVHRKLIQQKLDEYKNDKDMTALLMQFQQMIK